VFLTDRSFFNELLDFAIKRTFPVIEAMCQSGVDIINIGGNVPGGFLGKRIYDEYVLPYEKKYISFVKNFGVKALYHNCGQSMKLLESYKELGADIIEPFSPPPLGDGYLAKVKRIYDQKFTVIGNIDQVNILKDGTIGTVREITRNTVETGKIGGRFILQNADYLEYGTPLKNIKEYVKTGIEYGAY
jgi:uroporphyrinogen decarboxylase